MLFKLTHIAFIAFFPLLLQAAENNVDLVEKPNASQDAPAVIEKIPGMMVALTPNTAPDRWGVALTYRIAEIPYQTLSTTTNETVSDVVPLLLYEKGRFFWHGLEAGYMVLDYEGWDISLLGRYRFFDIPREYQNATRGNAYDFGLRYRQHQTENLDIELEFMNDQHGRTHSNLASRFYWDSGNWDLEPYVNLHWKSSKFNNHYYGLDVDSPGSDFDLTVGANIRYHLHSNLYLLGRAAITMYGSDTYHSSTIKTANQSEVFIGFGFFDKKDNRKSRFSTKTNYLKSKPYLRVAQGSASMSSLGEILQANSVADDYKNSFTSLFYGVPVSDTFFDIDMPIYFTVGYVQHHHSAVQNSFPEYNIGIKAYYTIEWPTRWRLGIAEGLSYATEITYIENTQLTANGYRASNLLNYIDLTIDVDLGDLFNSKTFKNVWLGTGVHHRSGIFETSSAFGRVKGGSNYTEVYLQYHW